MDRENGFHKTVAADCSPYSPALYRADKYYIIPRMKDPDYFPSLLDICEKEEINAILPLQEDELLLIAENQSVFIERHILPVISKLDIVELCYDKYNLYKMLTEEGIGAVPTFLTVNLETVIEHYGFPLFMKPRFGAGSVSNYLINTRESIKGNIRNESKEFIIQPYIEGNEYGINAYVDFVSGQLVEMFILKKIRMKAGETEKSVSVHNDKIKNIVKSICTILALRGPVDIDIMEKDGEFYVLEINPRFGGAYPHTHACGVNFIRLLSNNANNIANPSFTMEYEEGVVAFRYMTISTMRESDLPHEK